MRTLVNLLLFALTAALVSSGLGRLPRPRYDRSDAEFEVFLESKDEYDLLFFGSSRVYRGVVPKRFDAELKRRGHEIQSFNLGMRGMLGHEVNELLRRTLATQPARLRYVVVELGEWPPLPGNTYTQRAIAWHDWPETASAVRSSWIEDAPLPTRLENIGVHLTQFGARFVALGNAAEAVRARFTAATMPPNPATRILRERAERGRGYSRFTEQEQTSGTTGLHRQEFLQRRGEYDEHVSLLPRRNAEPADLASYNLAALRAQIASVEQAGVRIVFLLMPSFEAVPRLHRLAAEGHVPALLAFDDPIAYPELYAPEHRFDLRHLNREGAQLLTVLLAEQFSQWIASD